MTHILIGTPTAGGVVKSRFAATLVEVVLSCEGRRLGRDLCDG